jgi:plasminogen activator inhibitor 1 RNA-binding protein
VPSEHEKQAGHGWGYQSGKAELNDENAGEAIAKEEEKEGFDTNVPPPVNAEGEAWAPDTADNAGGDAEPAEPAEPEAVTKSYDEYQAELAEKKAQLGAQVSARKPNEGASKKFPEGKAFSRSEEQEDFIAGGAGKKQRERVAKEKNKVDLSTIDPHKFLAPDNKDAGAGRGGRGRGRGDRGGDRGDRGDRSDYRGRGGRGGDSRGGSRGRGDRGRGSDFGRGGRGGGARVNVDDTSAFPSLGA